MANEIKKVEAKSKNEKMLKLDGTWYFLEESIVKFAQSINVGDTVEFQSTKNAPNNVGKNSITYITVAGKGQPIPTSMPPKDAMGTQNTVIPDPRPAAKPASSGYYGQKTPEESERISRLSIAASTSNSLNSLAGQLDPSTLGPKWLEMYKLIYDTVNKKD